MTSLAALSSRIAVVLAICMAAAGCASLPAKVAEISSFALVDTQGTALDGVATRSLAAGENGFRLLPNPEEALEARLELIGMAERTLDLQYFIWDADASGRLLLDALKDAAVRGVRVRLLVDDLYTSKVDKLLEGLTGFQGIEVRLFNPFPTGRQSFAARLIGSLTDYRRVRHRMHNKLFVADNVAAIAGGRNIGDAYLAAGTGNFFDVDILAMGPIVREMSGSFDEYWNSELAYPGALIWGGKGQLEKQEIFAAEMARTAPQPETHQPRQPASLDDTADQLVSGSVALQVCEARLIADPVEKAGSADPGRVSATVHQRVIDQIMQAQKEVSVVSPYFVRGQMGYERIKTLGARGVRLKLLTNSLSTTDEPLAHVAYLRHRRSLMQVGLEIRELVLGNTPDDESHLRGNSSSRLHAKLAIVDDRFLYIGSLNFTKRSESINTELGLILDCPALAAEASSLIAALPAYDLRLSRNSLGIEWVDRREVPARVWNMEPEVPFWQRLKSTLLGQFVPEDEI